MKPQIFISYPHYLIRSIGMNKFVKSVFKLLRNVSALVFKSYNVLKELRSPVDHHEL
jgi:hypothetical protein